MYSTIIYAALVGHPCANWKDATLHAREIERATGAPCAPSYDGTHAFAGWKPCVRFELKGMTPRQYRRFMKKCARRGWPVQIYGYSHRNEPELLSEDEIMYILRATGPTPLPSLWHRFVAAYRAAIEAFLA